MDQHRSNCPINLMVEVLGDKWTFLVLRDIMFYKRRHFNQLLRESEEKIASNILRDRLAMLENEGMLVKGKGQNEGHKQKVLYSLTEKAIDVLPMMLEGIKWSIKYQPVDLEKYKPAIYLSLATPEAVETFRQKLLTDHVYQPVADPVDTETSEK